MYHPDEVVGIISVAPGLTFDGIPAIIRAIFRLFAKIAPKKVMKLRGMDINALSRDPNEVAKFADDPYSNLSSTPHGAVQLLDEAEWIQNNAAKLKTPFLLIHGEADQFALPVGSKSFFEKVTYEDKTFLFYPGGYHQPFIDINREEVFADMEKWLEAHM